MLSVIAKCKELHGSLVPIGPTKYKRVWIRHVTQKGSFYHSQPFYPKLKLMVKSNAANHLLLRSYRQKCKNRLNSNKSFHLQSSFVFCAVNGLSNICDYIDIKSQFVQHCNFPEEFSRYIFIKILLKWLIIMTYIQTRLNTKKASGPGWTKPNSTCVRPQPNSSQESKQLKKV